MSPLAKGTNKSSFSRVLILSPDLGWTLFRAPVKMQAARSFTRLASATARPRGQLPQFLAGVRCAAQLPISAQHSTPAYLFPWLSLVLTCLTPKNTLSTAVNFSAVRSASYDTSDTQPNSIDGKFKSDRTDKVRICLGEALHSSAARR